MRRIWRVRSLVSGPRSLRTRSENAWLRSTRRISPQRLRPLLPLPGGEGRGEGEPLPLHLEPCFSASSQA